MSGALYGHTCGSRSGAPGECPEYMSGALPQLFVTIENGKVAFLWLASTADRRQLRVIRAPRNLPTYSTGVLDATHNAIISCRSGTSSRRDQSVIGQECVTTIRPTPNIYSYQSCSLQLLYL